MSKITPNQAYESLKARKVETSRLSDAIGILMNDMATQMQPGSAVTRSAVIQTIAKNIHTLETDPNVGEWLDKAAEGKNDLAPRDQRNLELMQKNWIVDSAIPEALAMEQKRIASDGRAIHAEQKALRKGDYNEVKSWLQQSFDVMREIGQIRMDALGMDSVYDALLDSFSPGISVEIVETQFAKLDQALPALIEKVADHQKKQGSALALKGPYPEDKQMALNLWGLEAIGFDLSRGRLDSITGHPSSGGGANDARLTTFIQEKSFIESFKASVHEGGHGMYRLAARNGGDQPVDSNQGMTIHESQSMIIEYQACMTPEFISLLALKAQQIFGYAPELEEDNLKKIMYAVKPSLIRVYADELTYPMHVSLRTALERAIIERKLDVPDLPDAWNEGMKKRLGIVPENHVDGCMQDVHWYVGAIGYFPAYALGAMTAAQLFDAAEKAHPTLRDDIGRGDFTSLNDWLNTNIRERGQEVEAEQLVKDATGQSLNADIHIAHLRARYLDKAYGL